MECLIHCTDSEEKLTKLNSLPSWETLVNAARIRKFEPILKILYGEKVSREKVSQAQKIAKFYVLTFANDLLQLISRKINFRDQQKKCISRGTNFCD